MAKLEKEQESKKNETQEFPEYDNRELHINNMKMIDQQWEEEEQRR